MGPRSPRWTATATALVALACADDDPQRRPRPRDDGTAGSETGVPAAPPTSDTGPPAPLPPLGDECAPTVAVPGDPAAMAEPHAEVYGADPLPRQVRLGWPGNDPSRAVGFLWRTGPETLATVVELETQGAPALRIEGASYLFGTSGERIHEVRLCDGLLPGRAYRYRVGGDGGFSPRYTFRTPPAPGTAGAVRVAFLGDSRGAYEHWSQIAHQAAAHDPDFLLFTGDAVGTGTAQAEWDAWFRALGDLPTRIPVVFAHGNHEVLAQNYFAQVMLPGNEQWFTVKYGTLHLVVLNDTVGWGSDDLSAQATYIDRSFAEAAPGAIKAATHHQPPYATCSRHGSNEMLRDLWVPRYDANDVRIVFNGHNHIYERSVPIRDGVEVQPAAGTTYVTTGGAGAPLYPEFDPEQWFGHTAVPAFHYGIADFGPDGIHVEVRDAAGNVIDTFDR